MPVEVNRDYFFKIRHGNEERIVSLFDSKDRSDLHLLVGNQYQDKIYTHRMFLSISNKYFDRHLRRHEDRDLKLSMQTASGEEVGVPYKPMRALVQTIYTNQFTAKSFSTSDIVMTLKLAIKYEFVDVIPKLMAVIRDDLNPENVLFAIDEVSRSSPEGKAEVLKLIDDDVIQVILSMRNCDVEAIPREAFLYVIGYPGITAYEIEVYRFAKTWMSTHENREEDLAAVKQFIQWEKIYWRSLDKINIHTNEELQTLRDLWFQKYEGVGVTESSSFHGCYAVEFERMYDLGDQYVISPWHIICDLLFRFKIKKPASERLQMVLECGGNRFARFYRCLILFKVSSVRMAFDEIKMLHSGEFGFIQGKTSEWEGEVEKFNELLEGTRLKFLVEIDIADDRRKSSRFVNSIFVDMNML